MVFNGYAFTIFTGTVIHNAGVADFLKEYRLTVKLLPVLAKLLLPCGRLAVYLILNIDIGRKRGGFLYRRNIIDELNADNLAAEIANNFEIRDAVSFAGLDNILENLFCVLVHIQELQHLGDFIPFSFHFRRFFQVLFIPNADTKAGDIVLVRPDTLRQDRRVIDKSLVPSEVGRRRDKAGAVACRGGLNLRTRLRLLYRLGRFYDCCAYASRLAHASAPPLD